MSVPTDVGTAAPGPAVEELEPVGADHAWPTLGAAVGAGFVLWGLLIGISPLHDNSFLTHLATGRIIVDRGVIPRVDPYSFTAPGHPWVVQSWLASLLYGLADAAGGLEAVRMLNALLVAGLAAVVWRLSRGASLVPRVVIAALAVAVGVGYWVERPLLFGLLGIGLVVALADGRADPRWAVPIMWLWVNTHGSFPLGFVAVGLLALGARLDGGRERRELRVLGWMAAGTALAAVNPLGPRLLVFPLEILRKREQFQAIAEWQPLRLDRAVALVFLLQIGVAALLLARRRSWRAALPLVVFTALALTSSRNAAPASIVVIPGMVAGAAGVGTIDGLRRSRAALGAIAVCVVAGCIFAVAALSNPATRLDAYPEEAVTWLDQQGLLADHLVAPDYVGNYLEARYGPRHQVFIDDRVDMYPAQVVDDAQALLHAEARWPSVLERYRAGAVLWPRAKPLADELKASDDWRIAYRDADWYVFVPRD
jgi:hypothetical protein